MTGKLERTGIHTYTGYYSFNGAAWITVGTATVPGQAGTQDAGMFVTSHASGSPATVSFDGFTAADGAVAPPPGEVLRGRGGDQHPRRSGAHLQLLGVLGR